VFPVVVCGRERVTRSGRSLSRPCRQRRGGVLSTLRSIRAATVGDAKVVRLRHQCLKSRREPVARMIATVLLPFFPILDTPCFPLTGHEPRARESPLFIAFELKSCPI